MTDTPLSETLAGYEAAWLIIANAYHGNWDEAPPEWKEAAERWRDEVWHPAVRAHSAASVPTGKQITG